MRHLLLTLSLPLAASNVPTPVITPPTNPVLQVMCTAGWGTAFRVGPDEALSVAHVVEMQGCTINGEPFRIAEIHGDFAVLRLPGTSNDWLTIDCRGFVMGRGYVAEGFGRNGDGINEVGMADTGQMDGAEGILVGVQTAVPGDSGGPVLDSQTLKVVGAVNAADWEKGLSFATELKETSVCKA